MSLLDGSKTSIAIIFLFVTLALSLVSAATAAFCALYNPKARDFRFQSRRKMLYWRPWSRPPARDLECGGGGGGGGGGRPVDNRPPPPYNAQPQQQQRQGRTSGARSRENMAVDRADCDGIYLSPMPPARLQTSPLRECHSF